MKLSKYHTKRNFEVTPEPAGKDLNSGRKSSSSLLYVVQKHRASHLHYDFRLEYNGTLLSWAVPKGPSLDPSVKRLAMQVEDHPLDYADFEGVIPEGEYGGGTVMVWDCGTWSPESVDIGTALAKGNLKFTLHGKKLKGSWVLVKTHGYGGNSKTSWLLIKHRDEYASAEDITMERPKSARSNRLLVDIAREGQGNIEKAATGDPHPLTTTSKKPSSAPARAAKRNSGKSGRS
jgi:bifunctional non-homologous end joining protein LigD